MTTPVSMHCSNCQHWQKDGPAPEGLGSYGEFSEEGEPQQRVCLRIPYLTYDSRIAPTDPFVSEGNLEVARLHTPPSFSCSLWTPR